MSCPPKEPTCIPVHWEEPTSLWEWTLWTWGYGGRGRRKAGSAEFVETEAPSFNVEVPGVTKD